MQNTLKHLKESRNLRVTLVESQPVSSSMTQSMLSLTKSAVVVNSSASPSIDSPLPEEDHIQKLPLPDDRFSVEELVGKGSFGEVWSVQDEKLGRRVAVKYFYGSADKAKSAFQDEIQFVANLEHPGIPPIYDVDTLTDGSPYVIMKFLEGETLKEIIERLKDGDVATHEKYTFHLRIELIIQLLRIVAKAHNCGILHRDIKPENILVGKQGEVSLIDWGIAIKVDTPMIDDKIYGTPLYMSPEQCTHNLLTPQSDLFSVGAVAYELLSLTSAAPEEETILGVLIKLSAHRPKQVDHIVHPAQGAPPSEFTSSIMRVLSRTPEERQESAEVLLNELQSSLGGYFNTICPRTQIKGFMLGISRWLDRNPFVNIPIFYLSLLFSVVGLVGLGFWLRGYLYH